MLIAESIDGAEGGVASIPEYEFDQIRRRFGLSEPQRQAVVQHMDGRYYLDAHWADYDVTAEIHGSQHLEIANWDADLNRQVALVADGYKVLTLTSCAVRRRKDEVGALLTKAFRSGWMG